MLIRMINGIRKGTGKMEVWVENFKGKDHRGLSKHDRILLKWVLNRHTVRWLWHSFYLLG